MILNFLYYFCVVCVVAVLIVRVFRLLFRPYRSKYVIANRELSEITGIFTEARQELIEARKALRETKSRFEKWSESSVTTDDKEQDTKKVKTDNYLTEAFSTDLGAGRILGRRERKFRKFLTPDYAHFIIPRQPPEEYIEAIRQLLRDEIENILEEEKYEYIRAS